MAEYIVNTDIEESWYRTMGANYAPYFKHKIVMLLGNPVMEEVIRCRDCKYQRDCYCDHPRGAYMNAIFPLYPDGFCAWGERRVE